ncbi:hypothetical protein ACIQI7_11865 [Kitasatospora sp. NPDC092039]|nr:hypothetical protein KitaXyl93_24750 [Kitasatospora sp. Xyl93]
MSTDTLVSLAAPISEEAGPGLFLRIIVVASFVGIGLLVWLMARAFKNN